MAGNLSFNTCRSYNDPRKKRTQFQPSTALDGIELQSTENREKSEIKEMENIKTF